MILGHDRLEPGAKQMVINVDRMIRPRLQSQALCTIHEGSDHINEQKLYKVFVKDGHLSL